MKLAQALSWIQGARDRGLTGLLNGVQYQRMMAAMARRYPRPRPSGPFQTPGRILAVEEVPNGVVLRAEVIGVAEEPGAVLLDGQSAPAWSYEGGVVTFVTAPFDEMRLVRREATVTGQEPTRPRRRDR